MIPRIKLGIGGSKWQKNRDRERGRGKHKGLFGGICVNKAYSGYQQGKQCCDRTLGCFKHIKRALTELNESLEDSPEDRLEPCGDIADSLSCKETALSQCNPGTAPAVRENIDVHLFNIQKLYNDYCVQAVTTESNVESTTKFVASTSRTTQQSSTSRTTHTYTSSSSSYVTTDTGEHAITRTSLTPVDTTFESTSEDPVLTSSQTGRPLNTTGFIVGGAVGGLLLLVIIIIIVLLCRRKRKESNPSTTATFSFFKKQDHNSSRYKTMHGDNHDNRQSEIYAEIDDTFMTPVYIPEPEVNREPFRKTTTASNHPFMYDVKVLDSHLLEPTGNLSPSAPPLPPSRSTIETTDDGYVTNQSLFQDEIADNPVEIDISKEEYNTTYPDEGQNERNHTYDHLQLDRNNSSDNHAYDQIGPRKYDNSFRVHDKVPDVAVVNRHSTRNSNSSDLNVDTDSHTYFVLEKDES